jgi:hypothetical protein
MHVINNSLSRVCVHAGRKDKGEASAQGQQPSQARPPKGRDPNEQPQGLADMLPDWMGYGALYAITLVPIGILGVTVAILFLSSLK